MDYQKGVKMDETQPPSLHNLIEQFGTYSQITPEAWAKHDQRLTEWKARVRAGELHDDDRLERIQREKNDPPGIHDPDSRE